MPSMTATTTAALGQVSLGRIAQWPASQLIESLE
jgi:hypothetical protein